MPQPVRRFGGELLQQQLWCWGRDVLCPDGNLLIRFGFEQHRYTGSGERSTCYRLDHDDLHICMWGFGMFFGRRDLGGLFLGRFDFCPKWAPVESLALAIHLPAELPTFTRPQGRSQWQCARELWKLQLMWIADYESQTCDSMGIAYRQECVNSWMRPTVEAHCMAPAWRFISRRNWEQQDIPLSHALGKYTIQAKAS